MKTKGKNKKNRDYFDHTAVSLRGFKVQVIDDSGNIVQKGMVMNSYVKTEFIDITCKDNNGVTTLLPQKTLVINCDVF